MKYLALLFFALSSLQLTGQVVPPLTKVGFTVQLQPRSLDDFNQVLTSNDYAPMSDEGLYIEGYIKNAKADNRWMGTFGFTYQNREAGTPLNSNSIENKATLQGFGINSGLEYRLIGTKYFYLNPGVYLNFEYYRLGFTEGLRGTDLGSILDSDIKTFSASSFQVPIMVGLIAGVNFPIGETTVGITLNAGFKAHFDNANWKLNDSNTIDDEIDFSTPYIGIGFK